jgi:broad specificity phosphatase PhoE
MTYTEIQESMPEEFTRRQHDKLAYRYPRGESYLDVIARVEPMVMEMERHREPLLIIAHQGILRVIFAFYNGLARHECPHVKIPLNAVIRLQPAAVLCVNEVGNMYSVVLCCVVLCAGSVVYR